jgi:hypothetical protein
MQELRKVKIWEKFLGARIDFYDRRRLRACLDTPRWGWGSLALVEQDGHKNGYHYGQADDADNVHGYSLSPLSTVRKTLLLMRW